MNKVFCIIVTYNAMKWVDKCFSSLRESSVPIYPVVVDNCSKDETVEYIRNHYPEAYIIVNSVNRGFGQANNQGIEYAYKEGGTHFFLLNQDAWIHPDTVEKLVFVQDKYQIALVSPIHLNGPGTNYDYSFYRKIIVDEDNITYVSDLCLNSLKDYYPVFKINAAAWMLSRKAIENIGGFDPIYFHYGEDGNYCQRLHYHNEQCVFVPNSYIHHDRIRQGNMTVYKKQSTIMWFLFNYCDVNTPFFKPTRAKLIMHLYNLKTLFVLLFTFKIKELCDFVSAHFEFLFKLPQVKTSISNNKKLKANWLDLS